MRRPTESHKAALDKLKPEDHKGSANVTISGAP